MKYVLILEGTDEFRQLLADLNEEGLQYQISTSFKDDDLVVVIEPTILSEGNFVVAFLGPLNNKGWTKKLREEPAKPILQ